MNIVILGGAGFIGQKLAIKLAETGVLRGKSIKKITLCDMVAPQNQINADFPVDFTKFDMTNEQSVFKSIPDDTDVIFHLASIVSGQAEADMALGYKVNLDGMLYLLKRVCTLSKPPVLVFSSSIAVYSAKTPQPIEDHSIRSPQSSYGTQKVMCEMLLNDYSRKGLVDGRGVRLPTITVRPGKPNAAASSFLSSIIREPLAGQKAICPVTKNYRHYFSSPRTIIKNIIHAAEIESVDLGEDRNLMLPGISATVNNMLASLRNVAGDEVADLVEFKRDETIEKIVLTWVSDLNPQRALKLGFHQDESFDDFITAHIEDELS